MPANVALTLGDDRRHRRRHLRPARRVRQQDQPGGEGRIHRHASRRWRANRKSKPCVVPISASPTSLSLARTSRSSSARRAPPKRSGLSAARVRTCLTGVARFPQPVVAAHSRRVSRAAGSNSHSPCRYRVATDHPKTQLGLPEVQLGIIPARRGLPAPAAPRRGPRGARHHPRRQDRARPEGISTRASWTSWCRPAILLDVSLAAARQTGRRLAAACGSGAEAWSDGCSTAIPSAGACIPPGAQAGAWRRPRGNYPAPLRGARSRCARASATAWRRV